jgi:hypothetical protein
MESDLKLCIFFVNLYVHSSLENLKVTQKVLVQSCDVHLKFLNYHWLGFKVGSESSLNHSGSITLTPTVDLSDQNFLS